MNFPEESPPHFMAQGHMIQMVDIARLLARRGVIVSIFTTPLNAKIFDSVFARAKDAGLQIHVIQLHFPTVEAGLPEGCECFDMLTSVALCLKFFECCKTLQASVEEWMKKLKPSPSCILSDMCHAWTNQVAQKFGIPGLLFHGFCCCSLLCIHNMSSSKEVEDITYDSEYFAVPDLPDRIELSKAQVPGLVKPIPSDWKAIHEEMRDAEKEAYGVVVNSFEELEPDYVTLYRKAKGKKVWCVGPVRLCNKDNLDMAESGNKASINGHQCLKWLDSWEPNSVIYACLGSITRLSTSQWIEMGLGLEASNRPFVCVIRDASGEFQEWLWDEKFEERIYGRGLLIHDWAPQSANPAPSFNWRFFNSLRVELKCRRHMFGYTDHRLAAYGAGHHNSCQRGPTRYLLIF